MNIGVMTATLGVDTRGVVNAQQAMLNLQRQVLQSVRTMNASLQTMNATLQQTAASTAVVGKTAAASFTKTASALDGLTVSLTRSAQRYRTFGYLATAVVTLPMILMGKAAITSAKDFEYSMNKIVSLVGLGRDQVKTMTKAVLDMSTEVARKPQELADALYFITSAGFKDPAQALNILNISAKAASVGLGETKDVANLLTSAMNAYKTSNLSAARSADIVVAAVREGKIEADGFNSAMQSVIPIASALGISFAEVAGTMASLSLQGASAANSATYLKGVLNSLLKIKADSAADKAIRQFGFTADMLLEQLKQPGGLMEVLIKLKELSEKSTGNMFLKTIFRDIRAMTGALSLTGDNIEYNKQVIDAVVNSYGSLAKANQQTAETIQRRMDVALASANKSMIIFGESIARAVVPVIEDLVKLFNRLVEWYGNLSEATQRLIVEVMAFVAALGPFALAISLVKYGLAGLLNLGKGFVYLTTVVRGLAGSFGALRLAMADNPLLTKILLRGGGLLMNPYVALGVGAVALTGYLIHLKRKTEDAALAQSALYTTMVNVNGEIKKMKDLTTIDYTAMDEKTNERINFQAWDAYNAAIKNLKAAQERSGRTPEEWAEGKIPIRWRGYFEQQMQIAEMAKKTIAATDVALVALYRNAMTKEDLTKEGLLANMREAAKQAKEAMDKVWEDLKDELSFINEKGKLLESLGMAFDKDKEKLEAFNKTLDAFVKGGLTLMDNRLEIVVNNLELLNKAAERAAHIKFFKDFEEKIKTTVGTSYADKTEYTPDYREIFKARKGGFLNEDTAIMAAYGKELDNIALKNEILGDTLNTVSDQLDWARQMFDLLWTDGVRPGNDAMDQIIAKIKELKEEIKKEELWENVAEQARIYGEIATDVIHAVGTSFEAAKNRELKLAGGNVAERMRIEEKYARKMKTLSILQAIVNTAVGVTKALTLPPPASWIAAAITATAGAAEIALIAATPLAQGGIVPPGYPKDTYPARLTSGETVVPPGKLDNLVRGGGEVVFRIEGTTLVGVLQNQSRKVKSYS